MICSSICIGDSPLHLYSVQTSSKEKSELSSVSMQLKSNPALIGSGLVPFVTENARMQDRHARPTEFRKVDIVVEVNEYLAPHCEHMLNKKFLAISS